MEIRKNIEVTASQLIEYLHVNYQTFNVWLKEGILGDTFINPGRGKRRQFGFVDICAAKIAQLTLETTNRIDDAKSAVGIFKGSKLVKINEIPEKALSDLYIFVVIPRTVAGKRNNDTAFWFQQGSNPKMPKDFVKDKDLKPMAFIMIPIYEIVKDVDNFLNELKE